MATQAELEELNDYASRLTGNSWKQLTCTQYNLSRQKGKPHQPAMKDVYNKIITLANKITKGE